MISRKADFKTKNKAISLLLVLFYLLGFLNSDAVHTFVHPDEFQPLHTVVAESDPCHINIFHPGKAGGCSHTSHVKSVKKCCFDSQACSKLYITATLVFSTATPISNHEVTLLLESITELSFSFSTSRAPPRA